MVDTAATYDFTSVIDGFLAQKKLVGRNGAFITATIRSRALTLLANPDVRYVPAFKILDLLAAMVNIGAAIDDAEQLRPNEISALLRESLSDSAPLMRQFMLDATLERVRYEPMMLGTRITDPGVERDTILQRRWAAMRAVHQEKVGLPDDWIELVDTAIDHVIAAKEFLRFRQGPLLQLFTEMLSVARKLHQQGESLETLESSLSDHGALWRRYALKTARYGEKQTKPADIRSIQAPHTVH